MYEIIFRTRFERVFKKLDKKTQQLIFSEITFLSEDPFSNPNIRQIAGVKEKAFRLRVGRWRILYFVITKRGVIEVIDLFLRKGRDDYKRYV